MTGKAVSVVHPPSTIAPHPATTDLKALPVPEFDSTLDAYAHALDAVLDGGDREHAREIMEDFRAGVGRELDAVLRERAAQREAQGTNWLHEEWYSGYFTVRQPLPLSTNVGFQIALPDQDMSTGLDRAVEFIQRAASVHLQAAAGTVPEDIDARGNRITMNQWFVYAGGLRHPQANEDVFIQTDLDAARREIGVFVDGQLFAVQLSDAKGKLASASGLRAALENILATAHAEHSPGLDFNAPSLLGSEVLAEVLPSILGQGNNPAVYDRLRDMLFTIELVDDAPRNDADRIRDITFSPRGAWAYKPLSYQISLHDNWIAVHVEHSCQDGATLVTAITQMQKVALPAEESPTLTEPAVERITWEFDEATADMLRSRVSSYAKQANTFTAEIITVPHNQPADLPFKISRDASAQLTMSIAQQLTFGRVRAVYEAVDMREFRAGRTECLRAATPEAVNFAANIVDGSATQNDLQAAVDAHRSWVKRCKAGNGFDRHIQMMASIDASHPFFHDPDATAARRDFLSTTSIGGADQIVRYCFAPSLPEGFGISYTPLPEDGEFCISWNIGTADRAKEFIQNITKASTIFWDFCASLHLQHEA